MVILRNGPHFREITTRYERILARAAQQSPIQGSISLPFTDSQCHRLGRAARITDGRARRANGVR